MLKKCVKHHWLPLLVLFGTAFVLSTTTVFSYFSRESFGADAGIFAYVGYALTEGRAMYTGAWDNKGPLLYLIQALGILIHYRYGIYLLEILTLFLSGLLLYKTALLFVSRWTGLVCSVFCMLTLIVNLDGGNMSEEYALPFTIGAFYLICKFFCNDFQLKKWEMMLVGAGIGAVFMLRLNILAFLGCAVLGVILVLLSRREYARLGTVTLFAFLGFLAIVLPVALYLLSTGSLMACIESAYLGALGAFTPIPTIEMVKNVTVAVAAQSASGLLQAAVAFLLLFFPIMTRRKEKKTALEYLGIISWFGLILTLLANAVSGESYHHYHISFVPVIIIPVVWFAQSIGKLCGKVSGFPNMETVVCVALAVVLCCPALPQLHTKMFSNLQDGYAGHWTEQYYQVSNYVKENSAPEDTVQLIGNATAATSYYRAKRLAASNYFYYAGGRFTTEKKTEIVNKIYEDILIQRPKLIMFSNYGNMEDFRCHLSDLEQWDALLAQEYTPQENNFLYIIYKRNG